MSSSISVLLLKALSVFFFWILLSELDADNKISCSSFFVILDFTLEVFVVDFFLVVVPFSFLEYIKESTLSVVSSLISSMLSSKYSRPSRANLSIFIGTITSSETHRALTVP